MHIFNKAFRVLKKKNETKTRERPVEVLMRHVIVKARRTNVGRLSGSAPVLPRTTVDSEVGLRSLLYGKARVTGGDRRVFSFCFVLGHLFLESIVWSQTVSVFEGLFCDAIGNNKNNCQ